MKKIFISLFSFILILAGGVLSTNAFSSQTYASENEVKIVIDSGEKLVEELSKSTAYNNENVVIYLQNNISMEGVDTTPISDLNGNFTGVFDGNGYAISNLTLTSKNQYFGLIPQATNAIIKNIKITGAVNFAFDENNVNEIYAGVLLGTGENVVFENCEFDAAANETITIQVYSDLNFGMLAGKLKGNPLANSSTNRANIKDCVNYYGLNIQLNKQSNIKIGGLVGSLNNSFIKNTINQGAIKFTNNLVDGGDSTSLNSQYIGGIVGGIGGSGTYIRNTVYSGTFQIASVVSSLDLYKGAILGGAITSGTNVENINFVYFTATDLPVSGDNFVVVSEKVKREDVIDEDFLENIENFDQQSYNEPFDFDSVWSLSESRFHLQRFMNFSFNFSKPLDNHIESATFFIREGLGAETFTARYDETVRIDVKLKEKDIGYYKLRPIVLLGGKTNSDNYTQVENLNENGQIESYTITFKANSTTSGTYAFNVQTISYTCKVSVSEEAINLNQGGVRKIANSSTNSEIELEFTSDNSQITVVAESTKGSVYTFLKWELFYEISKDVYAEDPTPFEDSNKSVLTINYGTGVYDKVFKLVAYFTDENAILVDFGNINYKQIKSIKFDERIYDGTPIPVAPTVSKTLEIVTHKNYILNVKAFQKTIQGLYGTNSIEALILSDPEPNAEGQTTYKFSINMGSMENLTKQELTLNLEIKEDDSNKNNNMLYIWIGVGAGGAILIGLIIYFIVRHYRGGGRGGKNLKVGRIKEKKISYKDYYKY